MAENKTSISSLPEEVLINIFQYLNVRNRLNASLVCKRWLNFINCHKLLHDVKIIFAYPYRDIQDSSFCSGMTRQFEWFEFKNITICDSVVGFLKKFSKQFVGLEFINCKLSSHERESKYRERFLKCDNLKYLDIKDSDVIVLFAIVPNVTTLNIHESSDHAVSLTDYAVSQLNETLFKLEMFSLSVSVIYNEADYKNFYADGKTIETNPSKSVLSFASIKKFIEKHNTIKQLDISMLQLPPEILVTISNIIGLKLKNVLFPLDLPSSFIKRFCENQFSLKSLQLTSLLHVTDDTISAVCKCLPNLEKLVIKNNHVIDESIVEIFQLEHLEVLDLENSEAISVLSYQQAVLKLKAFKLKELNLMSCRITDHSLCELLMHNLNLRHLNISHTSVSNETLNMICKNLINLESLNLDSCRGISDPGITGEFEDNSDFSTPPLSNLKNLRKLDISNNRLITNDGCIKAIKFPNLRSLFLSRCDNLFFRSYVEKILLRQNPRLSDFILSSEAGKYFKSNQMIGYCF